MLSIELTGSQINQYLGSELDQQISKMLNETEIYNINENSTITSINHDEITKLLYSYKEILEKILKKLLKEIFPKSEEYITNENIEEYNKGYKWNTIEEFLNDSEVIITSKEIQTIFQKKIKEDLEYQEIKNDLELSKKYLKNIKNMNYDTHSNVKGSYSYDQEDYKEMEISEKNLKNTKEKRRHKQKELSL